MAVKYSLRQLTLCFSQDQEAALDALALHRIHFAFTITYHYLFPQLTMGLALLIVVFKTLALKTGDETCDISARFWAKIFAINFLLGVVTGIPMEFQFGTNWSEFSRCTGGVIGSWISCFFIIVTNAWMQHPVGYKLLPNGVYEVTSFTQLLFNPWALLEYSHNMCAAVITASFVMSAVVLTAIGIPATVLARPASLNNYKGHSVAFLVPLAVMVSVGMMRYTMAKRSHLVTFLASCGYLSSMLVGAATGLFPVLLPAVGAQGQDITIDRAISDAHALRVGLAWWSVGICLALMYSVIVYWQFRGKVPPAPKATGINFGLPSNSIDQGKHETHDLPLYLLSIAAVLRRLPIGSPQAWNRRA